MDKSIRRGAGLFRSEITQAGIPHPDEPLISPSDGILIFQSTQRAEWRTPLVFFGLPFAGAAPGSRVLSASEAAAT